MLYLLKNEPTSGRVPEIDEGKKHDDGGARVRCPKCGWEPGPHDKWSCSCLHAWNTFLTRGICPACDKRWADTQCPRCHEWSPHDDWYYASPNAEN